MDKPISREALKYARLELLTEPQEAVTLADNAVSTARVHLNAAASEIRAAQESLNELGAQAVAGRTVPLRASAAATQAIVDAEAHHRFCQFVVGQLEGRAVEARRVLKAAEHQVAVSVRDAGADLRIDAARRADAIQLAHYPGHSCAPQEYAEAERLMRPELAAAQAVFEQGTALINEAILNGVGLSVAGGIPLQWPTTEAEERQIWRRPRPPVEQAHAAD